jgi:hypothetical protein
MPIDFAVIADAFREPLTKQTHPLGPVFEKLEEAVKKLVEQSESAERATRAYPIFRYRNGALCVHVDPIGMAPLASAPPLGFVDGLKTGGQQFLSGIGWTRTAVRQELALPGLLGLTAEALQAVVDSIDRFAVPSGSMFDPRERRLSDAIGLLVLAYNSLLGPEARGQLVGAARGSMDFYAEYKRLFPDKPDAPAAPSLGTVDLLVGSLETASTQLLDAVVLLPILGDALAVLLHDGSLVGKRLILTELSELEAKAHGLRSAAIEGLLEGADLGGLAAEWLFAAQIVVLADVEILVVVGPSVLDSFLTGIHAYAAGVTEWGQWLSDLMRTIQAIVDAFMSFDLLGFAIKIVVPPWLWDLLPPLPTITVDDVISLLIDVAASNIRGTVNLFFDAASLALWVAGEDELRAKVNALASIFNIVLTPTPFTLPPDVMPTGPLAKFPDVYEAFFGGGRAATFLSTIDRFGTETRAGIRTGLGGAATLLEDLGTTFSTEADRAASMGSVARMRELALDSAEMAERVFGPEAERARQQAEARGPDELGLAFEQVVASGGFALVGNAIPAYVGELKRFWARRAPVERPTSPHILARHGRLGGVRVPRMTVRAPGRTPDATLASLVSARFHDAVGEAYASGRREFERAGEPPLRRPPRRPSRRSAPARVGGSRGR